ncbi:MAG: hypothetical protein GY861_13265 [bacterium]|nr:hypothetical protein [bacterium]
MIEGEIRQAANGVAHNHILNTWALQVDAGLRSPDESEYVTVQRLGSPPPISTESKSSADEEEEKRRRIGKEQAYQRQIEQQNLEEQWWEQQKLRYAEQLSLAQQRE